MGSQSATNIVETSVSMMSEVYNSSIQQCMSTQAENIGITIINSPGTIIEKNTFTQMTTASTTCVQKISYDTALSNSLDATFKQQADNAKAMFTLNPGDQSSYNVTRNMMNLSNIINNATSQQCTPVSLQNFMLNIIDSPGSTFSENIVTQSSTTVVDCTQGVATKSTAANDLKMVFDQVTSNSQETLTGLLEMLIILAIVIVLGLIIVGGTGGSAAIKQIFDWKTLLAGSVVIVIIFGGYIYYQSQTQTAVRAQMEIKAADSNAEFASTALDVLSRISGNTSLNGLSGGIVMPKKFDINGQPDTSSLTTGVTDSEDIVKLLAPYYNQSVGYYWWDPTTPKSYTFKTTGTYVAPYVQSVDKTAATAETAGSGVDRTGAFPPKNTDGTSSNTSYLATAQASYVRQWADKYGCQYDDTECDWSIVWRAGPSKYPNLRKTIVKLLKAQNSIVPTEYTT